MIAFIRLMVFGFVIMTIFYVLINIYSRSVRREKLENIWDEENPDGGDAQARDTYIEQGMREYEGSLRKKLIWLVYVIPTIVVCLLIYLTNAD